MFEKPSSIKNAVVLIWVSASIILILTLTSAFFGAPIPIGIEEVLTNFITVAVLALCAIKTNSGRGWPRWLLLVLFTLGNLMIILAWLFAPQVVEAMPFVSKVVSVLQFIIQLAVLVLLFVQPSRLWFSNVQSAAD